MHFETINDYHWGKDSGNFSKFDETFDYFIYMCKKNSIIEYCQNI